VAAAILGELIGDWDSMSVQVSLAKWSGWRLANLDLAEDEKPRMRRDLNAIWVRAQLGELDTAGVEPLAQVRIC